MAKARDLCRECKKNLVPPAEATSYRARVCKTLGICWYCCEQKGVRAKWRKKLAIDKMPTYDYDRPPPKKAPEGTPKEKKNKKSSAPSPAQPFGSLDEKLAGLQEALGELVTEKGLLSGEIDELTERSRSFLVEFKERRKRVADLTARAEAGVRESNAEVRRQLKQTVSMRRIAAQVLKVLPEVEHGPKEDE